MAAEPGGTRGSCLSEHPLGDVRGGADIIIDANHSQSCFSKATKSGSGPGLPGPKWKQQWHDDLNAVVIGNIPG